MKVKIPIEKRDIEPLAIVCKTFRLGTIPDGIPTLTEMNALNNLEMFAVLLIQKAQQLKGRKAQHKASISVDLNILSTLDIASDMVPLMQREDIYFREFMDKAFRLTVAKTNYHANQYS